MNAKKTTKGEVRGKVTTELWECNAAATVCQWSDEVGKESARREKKSTWREREHECSRGEGVASGAEQSSCRTSATPHLVDFLRTNKNKKNNFNCNAVSRDSRPTRL